jgi:hypothetical protein
MEMNVQTVVPTSEPSAV